MNASERPAQPGERCTCGRPAIIVYLTAAHGPVGYCGRPDGGARMVPCPFCGGGPHVTGWGDPARCPHYTLRPRVECIGCGCSFEPDSSPHLDRCWQCAERVDQDTTADHAV